MADPGRVAATLQAFLSYPSPQPDMAAVRSFVAEAVLPQVQGCDRVVIDGAGNLVAWRAGRRPDLPPLVWYTYGATYPAAAMPDPYPARLVYRDGRPALRGRGAAEQRTGLAAVVEALRAIADRPRPERGYMLVTCVAGEMGNHLIAEALVAEHALRAAAVVLAVATGGKILLGNLGRVDVHVSVAGQPGHSSNPAGGINAVDGAVEFLARLRHLPPLPADPDLGQATLCVTAIESLPRAMHTIPARCDITLDRRLVPGEEPAAAVAAIAACAAGIAPQRVSVRAGHHNLPGRLAATAPLARLAQRAATLAGAAAPFGYRRAALDAGYFLSLDMPALMWGPGDPSLAHTDAEQVDLDDAVAAARAYRTLTELACWEEPAALG